jgi:hypothetical protein
MYLKEIIYEDVDWIYLAVNRNMVMNLWVPQNMDNFVTTFTTVCFLSCIL